MCGLVAVIRTDGKDARQVALRRYEDQKSRGTRGFGFLGNVGDIFKHYERSETEAEIRHLLFEAGPCDSVIFHHRMPTSTENIRECNHPIKVSHPSLKYDYYVSHNGCITNDDLLKARHENDGFVYNTEVREIIEVGDRRIKKSSVWNDSEALAIELARDIDKDGNGVMVEGSIAFILQQVEKDTQKVIKVMWGRDDWMPLRFSEVKGIMITVCSEGNAKEIEPHMLYSLSFVDGIIRQSPYLIGEKRGGEEKIENVAETTAETTFGPPGHYYDLTEKLEALKRRRKVLQHSGRPIENINKDIEDTEDELRALDEEYFDEKVGELTKKINY